MNRNNPLIVPRTDSDSVQIIVRDHLVPMLFCHFLSVSLHRMFLVVRSI